MAISSTDPERSRPDVELRLPADSAFVSVLRTTAAGLAARLDFTLDDIEDLRMAVGEASSLAVGHAEPGTDLISGFHLDPAELRVTVSVPATAPATAYEDSFAWQVLQTLASEASASTDGGCFTITLAMRSSLQDRQD